VCIFYLENVRTGHTYRGVVSVCFYLTSGFAWPVRPRDAGPGADHRTGRVGLPLYIQVYYIHVTPPYTRTDGALKVCD
jgi:hypothetical protein